MASAIFRIGFSRVVVEAKWPNFKEAFLEFSVDAVARFGPPEISRLMADRRIIRNQEKLEAVIHNARVLQGMRLEGSFQAFVSTTLRARGEAGLIEELGRRFHRLGPLTSLVFLRMSGHEMPETMAARRTIL
jgi:DNA-3-methyladenine glycosylase I